MQISHNFIYVYPFPPETPSTPSPIPALWVIREPRAEPPAAQQLPSRCLVHTRYCVCVSALSQAVPPSPPPLCPHVRALLGSDQIRSVAQSCPTLCDPMNNSTPGVPFHHQLLEFTQTHVHRVSDAIQPSYPLSSPSPPAPNPSQHQSLFQ